MFYFSSPASCGVGARPCAAATEARVADCGILVEVPQSTDRPEDSDPEHRAHQAERRLQLLIDSVSDYGIFMLDPTGRIESWNRGAEQIKGYRPQEIIGQTIERFYTAEDRASGKPRALLDAARTNGRVEDEGWRLRKDGTRFWADVVITSQRDADGELLGFIKVTRDLTERREAEMRRLDLVHTQEALKLRDEFLSIAAHELRTPLFALKLQLESALTQREHLEEKHVTKLERATRNAERLGDLINTLMDVARIAQGKLKLAPVRFDLGALVDEVVDRLHEAAVESKCTVLTERAEGIDGVWDPLRIGQVLSNLLINSFKYAAGGRVDVQLAREGDEALLRVMDRGPGIPEAQLERVFGRFERAVSARHYGGLGLGLYVAREIVLAHAGTVRAHNRDGGGAVVEVRLPIGKAEA
jgi:PAS domain S-box-containing protein